jgi:Tfp pilus assembly protein PilP
MKTAACGIALSLSCLVHATAAVAQTAVPDPTRGAVPAASGYDTGGRRDPFVSLIAPKPEVVAPKAPTRRPGTGIGLAALAVTDVVVKGILRSGTTLLAILEAPDGRTFVARREDHLQNGAVKSIDAEGVVFVEQFADARGQLRAHDVRKLLHPSIGGSR